VVRWVLTGVVVGFGVLPGCKKEAPEAVAPPPVPAPAPAPAQAETGPDALLRLLSVHDPEPSCAALDALVPDDPVGALVNVVRTVDMPPTAPMRAARCLVVAHAEAAEPELVAWMGDPTAEGLARLVTTEWAALPTPVAVRVATAGLAGPHAAVVRPTLSAAAAPELRALAP
jgi:hypothetical protein